MYTRELNIKQLLIEAFESDKFRLALTFSCRIIKESKGSTVFKIANPWLNGILCLLKELYEIFEKKDRSKTDICQEIETTFISFGANLKDF